MVTQSYILNSWVTLIIALIVAIFQAHNESSVHAALLKWYQPVHMCVLFVHVKEVQVCTTFIIICT